MILPDFLIIGAPRSGTTFLSQTLDKHPNICMAKSRETHFFDINYAKGIEWYSQYFKHCKEDFIVGEKTASYLVVPKTAIRIKETLNDIKLLLVLRNPIDRTYSHYKNMIRWGRIKHNCSFNYFINNNKKILEMGNYYKHIKNYKKYFDDNDLLILFFEDLIYKTDETYKEILKFLNIKYYKRKQVNVDNPTKFFYKFGNYIITQKKLKLLEKIPILNKKLNLLKFKFPEIPKKERLKLQKYFEEKNEKLFNMLKKPNIW